eukprot:351342-Chlamydomonas_euryale.AAC.5
MTGAWPCSEADPMRTKRQFQRAACFRRCHAAQAEPRDAQDVHAGRGGPIPEHDWRQQPSALR